jgi:predicted Kef-type K+ transport protein
VPNAAAAATTAPPSQRPATVTGAAAATALPGVALTAYGVYQVVAGLTGDPMSRSMAETLGVLYLVFGLGICWVARGLLRCQAWARTPALMTFMLIGGVAYWMLQGGYDLYAAVSIAYGVVGVVLLFAPASHRVLTR